MKYDSVNEYIDLDLIYMHVESGRKKETEIDIDRRRDR